MKTTQKKDAVRNIRKQFVSFLSIMIVVSLGVGIFLACHYGARAIADHTNDIYQKHLYRDIQVIATKGIAEEDVRAVKELDGVADAEAIFALDLVAESNTKKAKVRVLSRTERIDLPELQDGKLPEKNDECAVEQSLLDLLGLSLGDCLVLRDTGPEETSSFLKKNTFTITGVIVHPDSLHRLSRSSYNVLLARNAFDPEAAGVENTSILIRSDAADLDTFSEEYRARVDDIEKRLVALGKERAALRDQEILSEAEGQLEEGSTQLADAKAQLESVREQLANGEIELEAAARELETNKTKLDNAKTELDKAESQLAEGKTQLDEGALELADAKAQLEDARAQLNQAEILLEENRQILSDAKTQLDIGRAELDLAESEIERRSDSLNAVIRDVWLEEWGAVPQLTNIRGLSDNYRLSLADTFRNASAEAGNDAGTTETALAALRLNPLWNEIESEFAQITDGEVEYANGLAQYNAGLEEFYAGEEEYRVGQENYERGLTEYEEGYAAWEARQSEYNVNLQLFNANKKSYEEGLEQYEAGLAQYESARRELDSGEEEFEEKEQELVKGEEELATGRQELAAYQPGNWVTTDRNTNIAWHDLSEGVRTFHNIGNTFAILFILLGALVCYATVGKIIDEQRRLVGTTKALGFTRREILQKYLLFGGLASLLGCMAGILLAYAVLQQILITKEASIFLFGSIPKHFSLILAILAIVISVAVAALSAWAACRKLLQQPATKLISGEVPPTFVKKSKPGQTKQASLYRSLIGRNIRTDIKRVLITIASIAGSCILLLVGFSLKSSFVNLIDRQFKEIIDHDVVVRYLPDRTDTAREDMQTALRDAGVTKMPVYEFGSVVQIGADQDFVRVICGDPDSLRLFYRLTDVRRNKEMRIPDEGVVIFRRLAEVYDLEVGDHISLLDEDGAFHDAPVVGICETFAGRTVFLSTDYAKKLFGERAAGNAYLVRLESTSEEALEERLQKEECLLQTESAEDDRALYDLMSNAINTVILVMILMAGIMAAVVLTNMLRIQINQKKRELTIMRVNGFTTKETIGYILRENILTTLLGIAAGVVAGNSVAQITLHSIERVEMQMIRGGNLFASVLAALITLVFAAIINYLVLRRIKSLKLSDVND